MAIGGPLDKGQALATLKGGWLDDRQVEVRSRGVVFPDLPTAEAEARRLAASGELDTIVVRDGQERFWVYAVDELARLGGERDLDNQVRGRLALNLPRGVSLQSFMASYHRGKKTGAAERVLVGGAASVEHAVQIRDVVRALTRAGLGSADIDRLRQGLTRDGLEGLRGKLAAQPKNPEAKALLPYVDAALALLAGSGRPHLGFDELATGSPTAPPPATPEAERMVRALAVYPEYRQALFRTVDYLHHTTRAGRSSLGAQGRPTARLSRVVETADATVNAFKRGNWGEVAAHLAELRTVLADAHAGELPGYGRDLLASVQERLAARLTPPTGVPAPAAQQVEAERLVRAYNGVTELVANAIFADIYIDFVDTFGNTGRVRPHDATSAFLRLNVSLWTVLRDLRHGAVSPRDFGKQHWQEVTAENMYDLAIKRLHADSIDYDLTAPVMLADPIWVEAPVTLRDENKVFALAPENIGGFMSKAIVTVVAPNEAAEHIEQLPFAQQMRKAAVNAARHAERDGFAATSAAAQVSTAYALFHGSGLPANASQALLTLATVADVALAIPELAPAGTSEKELDQQVKRGEILARQEINGNWVVFRPKPVPEIIAEIRRQLTQGRLDHLGPEVLQQIRELTGPESDPGKLLADRMASEADTRKWRQLSAAAVDVAVIVALSLSGGGAAAGAARAAGASRTVIAAARILGQVAVSVAAAKR